MIVSEIEVDTSEEWLSVLYYGAKKEFSETNGPFIKIY